MSKTKEYQLYINTIYLRTSKSKFSDREKDPELEKCNNFNDRKNDGKPIWIMQHHTVSNKARSLDHFLNKVVSAHYMIDEEGQIYQLVPDANRAYHAGLGQLKYDKSYY